MPETFICCKIYWGEISTYCLSSSSFNAYKEWDQWLIVPYIAILRLLILTLESIGSTLFAVQLSSVLDHLCIRASINFTLARNRSMHHRAFTFSKRSSLGTSSHVKRRYAVLRLSSSFGVPRSKLFYRWDCQDGRLSFEELLFIDRLNFVRACLILHYAFLSFINNASKSHSRLSS